MRRNKRVSERPAEFGRRADYFGDSLKNVNFTLIFFARMPVYQTCNSVKVRLAHMTQSPPSKIVLVVLVSVVGRLGVERRSNHHGP